MTYAVVDLAARTMTYARAGHTPLIYRRESGDGEPSVEVLTPDGLVLGLRIDGGEMFERLLTEVTIPLDRGDVLLLFTDGISEAMNARVGPASATTRLAAARRRARPPADRRAARADPAGDRRVRGGRAAARRHDDDPDQVRRIRPGGGGSGVSAMDRPEHERTDPRPLAVVFRTHSDIEASIVRRAARGARDRRRRRRRTSPHAVFPLSIDGLGEVRISVPAAQADAAARDHPRAERAAAGGRGACT